MSAEIKQEMYDTAPTGGDVQIWGDDWHLQS